MTDEIKDLVYELAVRIVDVFHENARLKAENKRLQKDIDERVETDRQILQNQMNTVGETLQALCDRAELYESESKCEYFEEIDYGYRQSKQCYAQKCAPEVNCNGCKSNCEKYPKVEDEE